MKTLLKNITALALLLSLSSIVSLKAQSNARAIADQIEQATHVINTSANQASAAINRIVALTNSPNSPQLQNRLSSASADLANARFAIRNASYTISQLLNVLINNLGFPRMQSLVIKCNELSQLEASLSGPILNLQAAVARGDRNGAIASGNTIKDIFDQLRTKGNDIRKEIQVVKK